jgi:hypothetical protein
MCYKPVACFQELNYYALGQTALYTELTSTCALTCMLREGAVKGRCGRRNPIPEKVETD